LMSRFIPLAVGKHTARRLASSYTFTIPTIHNISTFMQPSNTSTTASTSTNTTTSLAHEIAHRQFSSLQKGFRHRTHPISLTDGDYTDYTSSNSSSSPYGIATPDLDGTDWELDADFDFDMEKDSQRKADDETILQAERDSEARRRSYIEKSKPPIRIPMIDERGRAFGKGGRKTATAQVWISPGIGMVTVNKLPFVEYFPRDSHREDILGPMIASQTCGKFDIYCVVEGGGKSGQAGAMRHGLARALEKYNPDYRPPMKALGFMKRDPRKVERKKVGLKKARKAPQWVKR